MSNACSVPFPRSRAEAASLVCGDDLPTRTSGSGGSRAKGVTPRVTMVFRHGGVPSFGDLRRGVGR